MALAAAAAAAAAAMVEVARRKGNELDTRALRGRRRSGLTVVTVEGNGLLSLSRLLPA